jgi:hypothetical protein
MTTSQHDQSPHPAAPTCTTMSEADLVRDFEQAAQAPDHVGRRRLHPGGGAAQRGERRGGRGGSQPSQAPRG